MGDVLWMLVRTACVTGAALSLAGCSLLPWAEHDAQLYSPIYGQVGVGMVGLAPGDLFSQGDIPVCVDVPGSVTITSVEPVEPSNGLSVVAFAVRRIPAEDVPLGNSVGDLTSMGLTQEQQINRVVTNVCGEQSRANVGLEGPPPAGTTEERVELVVTVTASAIPASAQALMIRFTDQSGDERSATSGFAVNLCSGQVGDPCPSE